MSELESSKAFTTWAAPPVVPIIKDRILPEGTWMMIWGDQETFKSWLVLDLAWSVSTGRDWLVFGTNKHRVLVVNTELPRLMYHERWMQMVMTRHVCPDELFVVTDLGLKLDTDQGLGQLRQWVRSCKPGLVIVDNLYRTFSQDLNSGHNVNLFLDTVAYIREEFNCAFAFTHHARKASYDIIHREVIKRGIEDSTGSKFLTNNAAAVFEVRKVTLPGVRHAIVLLPEKMTFERQAPPPMMFKVDDEAYFHVV